MFNVGSSLSRDHADFSFHSLIRNYLLLIINYSSLITPKTDPFSTNSSLHDRQTTLKALKEKMTYFVAQIETNSRSSETFSLRVKLQSSCRHARVALTREVGALRLRGLLSTRSQAALQPACCFNTPVFRHSPAPSARIGWTELEVG